MTTDELKDLIASKIAGQGSAVDAGSALPEILNGIVDAIANPSRPKPFNLMYFNTNNPPQNKTLAEMAAILKVSEQDITDLFDGKIPVAQKGGRFYEVSYGTGNDTLSIYFASYNGAIGDFENLGFSFARDLMTNLYSFNEY